MPLPKRLFASKLMVVKYASKVMGRPLRFCMITTFYPPYHYGGDALFVQQLSNELAARGHQVEVIHYHNISLVGGPKILQYGHGIKLYTLHEYWLVCPTHMLFKFNREACTHRQCFSCTLAHRRPLQFWRYTNMLQKCVKQVDLFIAPSEFTKKKHLEMGLKVPVV